MRYTRDSEARSAAARKKRTRTVDDVFKLQASRQAKADRKAAAEAAGSARAQVARVLPNAERIAAKIRAEAEKKRR